MRVLGDFELSSLSQVSAAALLYVAENSLFLRDPAIRITPGTPIVFVRASIRNLGQPG